MAEGATPLDQETQRVIRLLQQAAGQCRALMLNPPGKTDSARSWASSQAAQKLAQIERQLVALNAKVAQFAAIKAEKSYREGLAAGDRYAERAGFRQGPLQGTTTLVDPARAGVLSRREGQQLGQIINETTADISKAVRSTIENTRAVTRKIQALGVNKAELDRLLAGGTIIGQPQQTLRELKSLLKRHAIDGKVVTVNTKTGVVMEFRIDTYAELVFQTKLAEATNIATLERLAARGCLYVKIIGSNSVRFCTAYVAKVFYFGPGTDPLGRYPHINQLPRGGAPFHPRCTKQYVAFNPKLATPKQMDDAMPDDRLKAMLGKDSTEAQKVFAATPKPTTPATPSPAVTPPTPTGPPAPSIEVLRAEAADTRRVIREIDRGFEQTRARLSKEIDDIVDRARRVADAGGDARDLVTEADRKINEGIDLDRARLAAQRDALRVSNPSRVRLAASTGLDAPRRKAAQDAVAEVAKLLDERALANLDVIGVPPSRKSGSTKRAYYANGKVHLPKGVRLRTVIHEIGHHVEDASPEIHNACLKFLADRTKGESNQRLANIVPGVGYKPNEVAKPDDFYDPYVGKDYGAPRSTYLLADGKPATEVLTMGLELYWANPAQLIDADPEHFDLIYTILRGGGAQW